MNKDVLNSAKDKLKTPCYIFDLDEFFERAKKVKNAFGGNVGLCYSIKANPFLTQFVPGIFGHLEVCSPGELSICERVGADMSKIIFSGVNKTYEDIRQAFDKKVGIFTAESRLHLDMINEISKKSGIVSKVILRLSHGSQFGIDEGELKDIIKKRSLFEGVQIIGLHYFTGTNKTKARVIEKELARLDELLTALAAEYGFEAGHIEYGTGLAVEYYKENKDEADMALLDEVAPIIRSFAERYPLTVEMGRFFAASCGYYLTDVMDIKTNEDINYVICDGGINQLNYYGQNMAMKVPPIEKLTDNEGENTDYCLCGSLCTTADILVRKVTLPKLKIGDTLVFSKCGAYSVCEGIAIFLSRSLPAVAVYDEKRGLIPLRGHTDTYTLNCGGGDI
ncbi:MAG: diaminopimelate decarboxylase [Ruminococcus sp.]|nr:diaminopimelate decarboxylase [Ruminococcus sp.]